MFSFYPLLLGIHYRNATNLAKTWIHAEQKTSLNWFSNGCTKYQLRFFINLVHFFTRLHEKLETWTSSVQAHTIKITGITFLHKMSMYEWAIHIKPSIKIIDLNWRNFIGHLEFPQQSSKKHHHLLKCKLDILGLHK